MRLTDQKERKIPPLVTQMAKNLSAIQETWVGSLHQEDPLKKEGHGNQLQYSCLENSMDRGAWWATDLGITKSQT